MANLNLSQFTEKTFVADADWTFVWDTAGAISKKVSRNNWLNSGTLATSAPVTISQTWDAGSNVMTALKVVATDTASGSGSNLLELWAGSTPALKLKIDKNGIITGNRLILDQSGSFIQLPANTALNWTGTSFLRSASAGVFSFENNTQANFFILAAEAANTLALRNSTAAQTFRVYNTYTDASNSEYLSLRGVSGAFWIESVRLGSGVARPLNIGTSGAAAMNFIINDSFRWSINTSGHFLAAADNTYDIGASGASRPRNVYVGSNVISRPSASITPANNSELVVEATSNTTLTFKLKGTDGTVRTATLTLAP